LASPAEAFVSSEQTLVRPGWRENVLEFIARLKLNSSGSGAKSLTGNDGLKSGPKP
jgi:hypothetical protein